MMLYFNAPEQEKAYPMKESMKELFTPENQNNKKHDTHFGKTSCYNGRGMDQKNG